MICCDFWCLVGRKQHGNGKMKLVLFGGNIKNDTTATLHDGNRILMAGV